MRKLNRSTGRRKKSRRLGTVKVMDRAAFAAADLNTKVAVIQQLIPLGLLHVQETLEAEVEEAGGSPACPEDQRAGGLSARHQPGECADRRATAEDSRPACAGRGRRDSLVQLSAAPRWPRRGE